MSASKTTRLTDFEDLKEVVIQCSAARKKKAAGFKVEETENRMLGEFG